MHTFPTTYKFALDDTVPRKSRRDDKDKDSQIYSVSWQYDHYDTNARLNFAVGKAGGDGWRRGAR